MYIAVGLHIHASSVDEVLEEVLEVFHIEGSGSKSGWYARLSVMYIVIKIYRLYYV